MRKSVSFLSIGLILAVLAACNQSSASSVPPEDMVLIPAGQFIMGTDSKEANTDQKPVHTVYLDAFYIDKHEVTNAQYEKFILAGGYKKREFWTEEGWNFIQKFQFDADEWHQIETPLQYGENSVSTEPDHPVIGVSWYEANAYAAWAGKRLPTEAEWEKAARGTDGRIYPWGNEMDFSKLSYFPHVIKLQAVGSFSKGASSYGVMDMAGVFGNGVRIGMMTVTIRKVHRRIQQVQIRGNTEFCVGEVGIRSGFNFKLSIATMIKKIAEPIISDFVVFGIHLNGELDYNTAQGRQRWKGIFWFFRVLYFWLQLCISPILVINCILKPTISQK